MLAAIEARFARQRSHEEHLQETIGQIDFTPKFDSSVPLEAMGVTPREAEVLLWVAQGKSNADIAVILGMAEKTVKKHLGNIFEKLGIESRNAAAVQALEILSKPTTTGS